MIHIASNVRVTSGGMLRGRVSGEIGGVARSVDTAAVYYRMIDAHKAAETLRREVIADLQALGYSVAV